MSDFKKQVLFGFVAIPLTLLFCWWMIANDTKEPDEDIVLPLTTTTACTHEGHTTLFTLHPRDYERFSGDIDKEYKWKLKHYPYKCKAVQ